MQQMRRHGWLAGQSKTRAYAVASEQTGHPQRMPSRGGNCRRVGTTMRGACQLRQPGINARPTTRQECRRHGSQGCVPHSPHSALLLRWPQRQPPAPNTHTSQRGFLHLPVCSSTPPNHATAQRQQPERPKVAYAFPNTCSSWQRIVLQEEGPCPIPPPQHTPFSATPSSYTIPPPHSSRAPSYLAEPEHTFWAGSSTAPYNATRPAAAHSECRGSVGQMGLLQRCLGKGRTGAPAGRMWRLAGSGLALAKGGPPLLLLPQLSRPDADAGALRAPIRLWMICRSRISLSSTMPSSFLRDSCPIRPAMSIPSS